MRMVLGLAVHHDCIRAVLLDAGAVAWAGEADVSSPERVAEVTAELLSTAPRRRIHRTRAAVVIGPAYAQTRVISGLPPLTDTRVLTRMVHEGGHRFFLKNGIPLVTGGVSVIEPGRVWAAAFDARVLHGALAGCRAARFRVLGVAPSVAVLGVAVEGDRLVWADGPVHAEVDLVDGEITAVRRRPHPLPHDAEPLRVCEGLAALGDGGWRFADAYGAATRAADLPLAYEPGRSRVDLPAASVRRAVAVVVAAAAVVAAITAPGLVARRRVHTAEVRLAELAEARNAAVAAQVQLERFTAVLAGVAAFDAGRHPVTLLLADIAGSLPEGNALVAFRIDSAGGTLVALGRHASGVVTALDEVESIASPRILGPVTRERSAGRELERVTVHFLWGDGGRAAAASPSSAEGSQ